jgi:hypothetical protein
VVLLVLLVLQVRPQVLEVLLVLRVQGAPAAFIHNTAPDDVTHLKDLKPPQDLRTHL